MHRSRTNEIKAISMHYGKNDDRTAAV